MKIQTFLMILIFNLVTFQTLTFLLFASLENLSVAQILVVGHKLIHQVVRGPPKNSQDECPVSKFY